MIVAFGWSLTNPAGLGLAALAIPVILLHILRPRRQEVTVSSTFLWRTLERPVSSATPWQRLRWSALLLAQLLAVCGLALAVARPVRLQPATLAAHTVFIVDASSSMRATDVSPTRLAAATAKARALAGELPDGGLASVVVAGQHPRVALTASGDRDALASALRGLEAGQGRADFAEAFSLAESLDTGTEPIGFVLLSDGGLTDEEQKLLPPGTRYERIGATAANRSVERVDVEPRGSGLHARVTLRNHGDSAVTQQLRFDVDGVTAATQRVTIPAAQPLTVEVDLPAGERVEARLDGGDILAADDVGVAVADRRPDRKVLIAGSGVFWTELLTSIPGVTVDVAGEGATPDGTGYDAVIYDGVAVPAAPKAPFLAVASPGGVPGASAAGVVETPSVTLVHSEDPLLAGIDLSGVAIATAQRVTPTPQVDVLVAGENAPLLMRGVSAGRRFAYLTFSLTDSNLAVQVAFPQLGDRLLTELTGLTISTQKIDVGADLPIDPAVPATVSGPGGQRFELAAGDLPPPASAPGFWVISVAERPDRVVAVNPPAAESAVAPRTTLTTSDPGTRPATQAGQVASSLLAWVVLALLAIVAVEAWLAWRGLGVSRGQWRVAAGLRILVAVLLLGAWLAPSINRGSDRQATVFLLDRSASLGSTGTGAAEAWLKSALAKRPEDALSAVVVFGAESRLDRLLQASSVFDGASVVIDSSATDIASAIRLGSAVLPSDAKRRLVLISDGRATAGNATAEATQLSVTGVPVDTHLIESGGGADAAVSKIVVPRLARVGDRVTVTAHVEASRAGQATVTLRRDGSDLDSKVVTLQPGDNTITFQDVRVDQAGAVLRYQVAVAAPGDVQPRNDQAFAAVPVQGPAKILVVEGTAGEAATLDNALRAGGVATEVVSPAQLPAVQDLATYTGVVLVDVSAAQLSAEQIANLSTVVRDLGRGLLTVGGPRSYGAGGYRESPLGDLLPVDSEILDPKRRRTVAEVLSIDTSGSMAACHCRNGETTMGANAAEGGVNKTDISRAAAERAIQSLTPNDEVGVVAWNSAAAWVIELQKKPGADVIDDGLRRLRADGNTNILASLRTAADALKSSAAELKHIIVFTDGFTDERLISQAAEEAATLYDEQRISVSVLGTGEGAAPQLARIAEAGHGRFYPGKNLADVPEIMAQEAVIASRNFINEGEFTPEITSADPVVAPLTSAPALLGYVATTTKGTASTLMRIGPDRDPLLASWQAGLGRVSSWTSDASSGWSKRWADWDGYVDFWTRLVKSTFQTGDTLGAAQATISNGRLHVSVQSADAFPDGAAATAVVAGPDGQRIEVPLVRTAGNTFEGDTTVSRAGTYAVGTRVDAGGETVLASSTLANDSYPAEFAPGAADANTLARLASLTGGRADITPEQAFDTAGLRAGSRPVALAGLFLLLAALLWPIAVALSRLSVRGATVAGARAGLAGAFGRVRAALPRMGAPDPTEALQPRGKRAVAARRAGPPSPGDRPVTPVTPAAPVTPGPAAPRRQPVAGRGPAPATMQELLARKRQRRGDGESPPP